MADKSTNKNFRVRSQKPQIISKTEKKRYASEKSTASVYREEQHETPYFKISVTLMIQNLPPSLSLSLYGSIGLWT
jgi:hypothetical protein